MKKLKTQFLVQSQGLWWWTNSAHRTIKSANAALKKLIKSKPPHTCEFRIIKETREVCKIVKVGN